MTPSFCPSAITTSATASFVTLLLPPSIPTSIHFPVAATAVQILSGFLNFWNLTTPASIIRIPASTSSLPLASCSSSSDAYPPPGLAENNSGADLATAINTSPSDRKLVSTSRRMYWCCSGSGMAPSAGETSSAAIDCEETGVRLNSCRVKLSNYAGVREGVHSGGGGGGGRGIGLFTRSMGVLDVRHLWKRVRYVADAAEGAGIAAAAAAAASILHESTSLVRACGVVYAAGGGVFRSPEMN